MISSKQQREISGIVDTDPNKAMQKQLMWVDAASRRQEFLKKLRADGYHSKKYSSAVAEYDRNNMSVFYP